MRNKYQLPHPVRMQVIWMIRDYDRMKWEYDSAIYRSAEPSNGHSGGSVGNPTESSAIKREPSTKRLEAIEQALNTIPEEYRKGIWDNIVYYARYPMDASQSTYRRNKAKFLYRAAKNLELI